MSVSTSPDQAAPNAPAPVTRSLVIPVYGNEDNIADLVEALERMSESIGGMEVVFVVDGSPDRSGELLLAARKGFSFPSRIAFHSRNFGSFTAIRTGMELAKGRDIAVMAADLQEPPELIAEFFSILDRDEADIVFGERVGRHDFGPARCALQPVLVALSQAGHQGCTKRRGRRLRLQPDGG